jgi:hypothetical protein
MASSTYTQEVADEICALLESGESLNAVCKRDRMPLEQTVRGWARDDREGFAAKYARAREIGYLRLADEILEISDDGTRDTYKDEAGVERTDQDHIARSRLRVDSRKWLLSKMLPKVFGDKIEGEVTHTGTITVRIGGG